MALQPSATDKIDRSTTAPFLLRLFWRQNRTLDPYEFSIAPPADTTGINEYYNILPPSIRHDSVEIYTWSTCTLRELTSLLTSALDAGVLPEPAVGTRLVYKLIFPDTRAPPGEGGRGKWIDKPLGTIVIGGNGAELDEAAVTADFEGDFEKTLADARFVIGDYVACSIYPPGQDGRVPPHPGYGSRSSGPSRGPPRGENGFGRGGGRGYGGGRGGRGGPGGAAPPPDSWTRGQQPPGAYGRGGGGGYGGRARPY